MRARLRFPIAAKLLLSSLVTVSFLVGVAYVSYSGVSRSQTTVGDMNRQVTLAERSQRIEALVYRQGMDLQAYVRFADAKNMDDFQAASGELLQIIDELQGLTSLAATREDLQAMKATESNYIMSAEHIADLAKSDKGVEAQTELGITATPLLNKLVTAAEKMAAEKQQRSAASYDTANARMGQVRTTVLWVAVGSLIIALLLALVIARNLSAPIRRLAALAAKIAEGDLTVEPLKATSRDEVGDVTLTFNQMTESLRSLVRSVQDSSTRVTGSARDLEQVTGQVTDAAHHVTEAVGQVAKGATEQSTAAQEAARTVTELRTAIDQIAAGAQEQATSASETAKFVDSMVAAVTEATALRAQVQQSTHRADAAAVAGGQIVETSAGAMQRIRETVTASATTIRRLGDLSAQIDEITQTITGIAHQTNLLALNAAIEAARAGEQGRGFAVVADEVRKLAERAASSAQEIGSLITTIQHGTAQAVAEMEQISADVAAGAGLTEQTRSALDEIKTVVAHTVQEVTQITARLGEFAETSHRVMEAVDGVAAVTEENTASTEQMAAGAEQMNSAIAGIAAVSEENAAAAEEVSASMEELSAGAESISGAARELAAVARELQGYVAQFKV